MNILYQDCGHAQTQTPVAWRGCCSWRGCCGPCWPGAGARLPSAPRPPGPSTARPGTAATTTPPASGAAAASAAPRARSRGGSSRTRESGDYHSVMSRFIANLFFPLFLETAMISMSTVALLVCDNDMYWLASKSLIGIATHNIYLLTRTFWILNLHFKMFLVPQEAFLK